MVIHRFLTRQLEVERPKSTRPRGRLQSYPAQSYSQVSICTWTVSACSRNLRLVRFRGIEHPARQHLHARDHVVLDVFDVCDKDLAAVTDQRAIQTAEGMLERMLSDREHVELHDILKRLRVIRGETPKIREVRIPTLIDIDNETSKAARSWRSRPRTASVWLYAITHTLSELGLDISFAKISTEKAPPSMCSTCKTNSATKSPIPPA